MLGSQIMALWEVVETLGDETWLEEVGHWEQDLGAPWLLPVPVIASVSCSSVK